MNSWAELVNVAELISTENGAFEFLISKSQWFQLPARQTDASEYLIWKEATFNRIQRINLELSHLLPSYKQKFALHQQQQNSIAGYITDPDF